MNKGSPEEKNKIIKKFIERHSEYKQIKKKIKELLTAINSDKLLLKLTKDNELCVQEDLNRFVNFDEENNEQKE